MSHGRHLSTRPLQADPERERLDAEYMGRAIQASRESLEAGDMPYGAVLVSGGGDLLPIRCAQTLAGAVPPVQVDGPMEAEAALRVLREAADRAARG